MGVEYSHNATAVHTVTARREVILAAGAIGSPQLLMLSGVGPQEHLSSLKVCGPTGCGLLSPEVAAKYASMAILVYTSQFLCMWTMIYMGRECRWTSQAIFTFFHSSVMASRDDVKNHP